MAAPMQGCGPHHWGLPQRQCRREAKELLADDTTVAREKSAPYRAIIGGCCCVSLSIEYMPADLSITSQADCSVEVGVQDAEGSTLAWLASFKEGYHVKDGIITTYPGAILVLKVTNAIARVRWCETFSC
jgi:hypothetical protein